MKKLKNLCLLLSGIALCAAVSTGCVKNPGVASDAGTDGQDGSRFDYATTINTPLNVDYSIKGNKALFEVYTENPVTVEGEKIYKKKECKALLKAYTDKECKYSGVINLPIATDKIWLYSESYGLPACMEAEVTSNGISFDMNTFRTQLRESKDSKTVAARSESTRAYSTENPYNIQVLGTWDNSGLPYYIVGERHGDFMMPYTVDVPDGLLNRINNVLMPGAHNVQYAKPTKEVNTDVTKDTGLSLVFLADMGQWRNAVGYYYYDTQNPPKTEAEFDALPKYIAFPNCSVCDYYGSGDVIWGTDGFYNAPMYAGIYLKMKYFKNGKASEIFPKGTTVGWFMLPDGFEVTNGKGELNISGSKNPIRYSNNEFNKGGDRYLVSLYDKVSGQTVLGFEDSESNSGDFKDVLCYVDADVEDAISNSEGPATDPDDEKYPDITGDPIVGTLAFEDLWPSQGDYDMNDVVVAYSTTFTTDKENRIVAIEDVFTPLYAGGKVKSAFGYQLDLPATAVKSVQIDNGSSSAETINGLELQQSKAVIMLFDDIRQAVERGPITVDITLNGDVSLNKVTQKSLYNPFICVSDKGFVRGAVRKEIHLTDYAPTSLADPYPFGRNDDKSPTDKNGKPVGPSYYVTSDLHPFAIDLPVTDYRIPDEMVKIDDFYPNFTDWVMSKGEKYKDWYLKPVK